MTLRAITNTGILAGEVKSENDQIVYTDMYGKDTVCTETATHYIAGDNMIHKETGLFVMPMDVKKAQEIIDRMENEEERPDDNDDLCKLAGFDSDHSVGDIREAARRLGVATTI